MLYTPTQFLPASIVSSVPYRTSLMYFLCYLCIAPECYTPKILILIRSSHLSNSSYWRTKVITRWCFFCYAFPYGSYHAFIVCPARCDMRQYCILKIWVPWYEGFKTLSHPSWCFNVLTVWQCNQWSVIWSLIVSKSCEEKLEQALWLVVMKGKVLYKISQFGLMNHLVHMLCFDV